MNSPEYLTAGMFYNRWGYALLWLLLIETLSPRVSNRWVEFWGGLSTGVIIGLLLFLKVNYFASAVFLVGTLWICKAQSKERWVGIATGSAAIFLVFCAYLGFTLTPMWEDLTTVAQTKQLAIGPFLRETLSLNVFPFVAFILVSLFLFRPAAFRLDEISVALAGLSLSLGGLFLYLTHWPHHAILANVAVLSLLVLVSTVGFRRDVLAVNLGGLCACFAGLCLLSTNWQFYQLPLNTVVTILVIDWLASRPAGGWLPMRAAVVLSGLALFVSSVSMDARGLAFGFQQRAFGGNAYVGFNDSRLAGFTGDERAYVESINDGLSLLRKYKKADDTLVVVDYANPFSYTLGIKPSSGGATWLHYGTDLDMSRPSPERVFGGSSLAMVPKVFYVPVIQEPVQRIFRPFLLKHYEPIAESPRWWLYRRVGQ
jgi:hypothetical protein